MTAEIHVYTDGGARPNPGHGGAGVVLRSPEGELIERFGRYLGRVTNNEAEYLGIELGLEAALRQGAATIRCFLDSELACKQLNGMYEVKDSKLKIIHTRVSALADEHDVTFKHFPREMNQEADRLATEAILSHRRGI